jgi:hypothetical protein
MRKYFLILFLLVFSVQLLQAQVKNSFLKWTAVSFGFGLLDAGNESLSSDQVSMLATDPMSFTPIDLSTYHQGKYQFEIIENGAVVFQAPTGAVDDQKTITHSRFDLFASFNIHRKMRDDYAKHFELRIGIFYQPYQYQEANYVQTEQITGDSSVYQYAYYDAWTPMPGVDGAFLFRTDPDKWFNLYAGLGIGFGASVNPKVAETFGTMTSKTTSDTSSGIAYPMYHFAVVSNTQNVFPGKTSVMLEGRLPIGVNLRLYKTIFVFLEGDLTASKQFFVHDGTLNQGVAVAGCAGLRVRMD